MRLYITTVFLLNAFSVLANLHFENGEGNTITGFIRDEENNPVAYALVKTENGSDYALTNTEGFFTLDINIIDDIYLAVSCIGFENARVKVADNAKNINITLVAKPNYLNEVVITGDRTKRVLKDVPVLTKVITAMELQNTGSMTVLDALENIMPGVHFDPSAWMGDNIQIQGLDNNYVLILIDGERAVPERRESVNFARLNVAEIERIEIISGSSSVLYGSNAMGFVINIITKEVKKPLEGYVQERYTKYNSWNTDAAVGFKWKGLSSKTAFNFKITEGYDLTPESPTYYTVNPNNDISVSQNFGYKFSERFNASLNGSYYRHNIENPPASVETTHSLDNNYTLNAKANYKFSKKNIITGSAHTDIFKSYKVYEKKNDSIGLDGDYYYATFRIIDEWNITDEYQIIGGVEHNDEQTFSVRLFGSENGDQRKKAYNSNIFLQGTGTIFENLEGVLGLRYTYHSGFGSHLTPSLSLMYKLSGFRFRGGVNSGFKAPTLKEMYYNFNMAGMFDIVGNPDLKSETGWYKFVSAEYINENINASLLLSHNRISDKINIVERHVIAENGSDKTEMHYENIEDVGIIAFGAFIQCRFLNYFQAKADYSYANAKNIDTKLQIEGNSKHNLTTSIFFKYPGFRIKRIEFPFIVALTGKYSSPRIYEKEKIVDDETVIINENSNDFYTVNLFYTQKIPISGRWNAEIQLGVDNMFNYIDDKTFASINPGRRFSILTRINF
ncbi:MAG: TonB-dependent receptor [Bacteroidales bacterium]|nr:TonB-dependent receptor [Bacteroidales bacterium]